jgi:hypothetical protein
LNVPIACWLPTEGDFTPTASMAGTGEKLGMDPRIGQPARWGLCREPFFSGAGALSIAVEDFTKGCHIRGPLAGSVRRAYVDWSGKRMCRVGRVSPSRVYIDSNRRDSRI